MAPGAGEARDDPEGQVGVDLINTDSLSAQAGFALRVAGQENIRILQGGFAEWKAKGGFDAATRAAKAAGR